MGFPNLSPTKQEVEGDASQMGLQPARGDTSLTSQRSDGVLFEEVRRSFGDKRQTEERLAAHASVFVSFGMLAAMG